MNPSEFVAKLAAVRMPSVFNPYANRCRIFDRSDAPAIRRANLRAFLEASLTYGVDTLWVARDFGYRGGRRTGIALTDEARLASLQLKFPGPLAIERATIGPVVAERTANVIWEVIGRLPTPVFTWNVFPLHPHVGETQLSNRCHTRAERHQCSWALEAVAEILKPKTIIAIGNDAADGLADLGFDFAKVRHPSYGGQSEFRSGISDLYNMRCGIQGTEPDYQPRLDLQSNGAAA